jgi:hypothetical protein
MSVEINEDYSHIQHLHILRENRLLKHVIKEKIMGNVDGSGRRGRRRKQLLDDLKERMGYNMLKEEPLDRTRFGRGCGPVVRQKTLLDLCGRDTIRIDESLYVM